MAEFPVAKSNFEAMLTARGPVGANNDPVAWLPEAAGVKLRALRQRADDMRSLLPDSDVMNGLRAERAASEARLKRLRAPAQLGGFAIRDDQHPSVVDEQAKLDALAAELARLVEIDSARGKSVV